MTTTASALTRQRLLQLAKEAKKLADWTMVRDFATQMYGEGKVVKVEIETYGEYNDEGGTNYHINGITAYDKDGNELELDYSLPFFATDGWKEIDGYADISDDEDEDEAHDEDFSRLREVYFSKEDEQRGHWILIEDLPCDEHNGGNETYDLTTPPALTLPTA
jgi:coenzyme F420-reducing hydrogenase alpha subunit